MITFFANDADDIAWHTEAIADHSDLNEHGALVLVRQSTVTRLSVANATQIFVHTLPTSPAPLRAGVCGELEFLDLSVNDARVYLGSTDGSTHWIPSYVLQEPMAIQCPVDSHTDTILEIEDEVLTEALSGSTS